MKSAIIIILSVWMMAFLTGCHRGIKSSSQLTDSTEIKIIEEMQQRGSDYRNNSDFERAIITHDSCIQLSEAINDTIQLVIALNNQGTNYRRLSANKEAAEYHFRALHICDAFSDTTTFLAKKNRVRALNGLGNVMLSLGNYKAAEKSFHSALAGEKNLNSATGQAINLANIGSIKEHYGDMDSARFYYTLSMQKNREDSNMIGISLCYTYFGELDKKAGHVTEAINNFRQAYAVGLTTGDVWHWLTPCLSLAHVYADQNAADSAYKYINIGIEAAKKIHSNEHLRDFYGARSRLEKKQGKTAQALADLETYTQYNDSVLSEEERNSAQNARANYESSRRNIEVKAANEDAQTSRVVRNIVIIAAILVAALMAFAFWMYRRYVRMRNKNVRDREIFMRNIAHQLRTPMTVVAGLVEQLKGHIPAGDTVGRESLEATQRQSKQLQNLILQLAHMPKKEMDPLLKENGDLVLPPSKLPEEGETTAVNNGESTHIIPLPEEEQGGVASTEENQERVPSILLAEDTDDVAKMMCGLLREHGYSVNWAADGMVALDILKQSELPDLLITDIAMPRMDGLELMRRIREDDTMCHLPIIVTSARVEDSERMEGISAGAEVYLTKPFIPEELLLRVSTMLAQRERLRRSFSHLPDDKEDKKQIITTQMNAAEQSFIEKMNRLIDDNMSSGDVNVNFVAENLCVSVSTINRKVKNITDMACSEYILNRRREYAKRLLLTDASLTIAEIGYKCGFSEPTHFTRWFKRETGLTPSQFRNQE